MANHPLRACIALAVSLALLAGASAAPAQQQPVQSPVPTLPPGALTPSIPQLPPAPKVRPPEVAPAAPEPAQPLPPRG